MLQNIMRFFIILFLQINLVLSVTIISTWSNNFRNATAKAFEATTASNYMFGLVEGLSTCERLQCDTTVGWGGSPDENGETTLDAMVMDGMTMNVGAVANLRRVRDAAKVAWAVANYTKHTLLTGDLATEFAKKMGFKEVDLSSNGSKQTHQDWLNNNCQPNFWRNVQPDPNASCGPYTPTKLPNKKMSKSMNVDIHNHDTIGMVVLDNENKISAGTSSNGATHKIPGRVGDAPIPGAGAYATSIGGAAATGDGDIMMRFLPSFYIVHEMELGSKPQTACKNVIKRILKFFPDFQGGVVALHHTGVIGASCANLEHFPVSFTTNGTIVTRLYQCLKPVSRFE